MEIVRGLFAPLPALEEPVATIGAFDGVHRGHQAVIETTVGWAREVGGHAVVVTFDPLPKAVLGAGNAPCLTSLDHRLVLIRRLGVDAAVVLEFDRGLAEMPARRFVEDVLVGWLGARRLVLGQDATFGRGREGNARMLGAMASEGLVEVRTPPPVLHRGQVVSSTAIREAVARGDLDEAAAMLGRPFSLYGTVVRGAERGRSLGFPTANLDLHNEAIPPDGVYATITALGSAALPSLTYIGRRPTFEGAGGQRMVEVHILDHTGDLYGRRLEVRFVKKLRDDIRFPSPQALVEQMKADRQAALEAITANRD